MGLFGLSTKKTPAGQTTIRNAKELEAFFVDVTKDEWLAQLLVEVANKVGRDGYLEVERGGNGTPYMVEYQDCPEDSRTQAEVQAEYARLKEQLSTASSPADHDLIERRIAHLVGGFCRIRINVMTSDEFGRQRDLIAKAWAQLNVITRKTP